MHVFVMPESVSRAVELRPSGAVAGEWQAFMRDAQTPILIVGAGPAGLTTALALTEYGTPHLLIERYPGTAHTPRAHVVNQRTVEIMRHLGVEDDLKAVSSPQESMRHSVWYTTLNRPEVARYECWGTERHLFAKYMDASPCTLVNCPQTRFEPMLVNALRERGGEVAFGHEFIATQRDGDGWISTIRDRSDDSTYRVRSTFVIGADGAKANVLDEIGLDVEGEEGIFPAVNIWFRADLSKYLARRAGILSWNVHPGPQPPLGLGTLICMEPFSEFVLLRFSDPDGPDFRDMSDQEAIGFIEAIVGEPVDEVEILGISGWVVNEQVAPVYGRDGAYCMGDAVHRHPPTNGLGLNMSVADGYNLAWKLALVEQGLAGRGILDTYSAERQPVGAVGVARAMRSLREAARIPEALGYHEGQSEEDGWRALEVLKAPTPEGDQRRTALRAALANTDFRFNALGLEVGYQYEAGALIREAGDRRSEELDPVLDFEQTTRPGARVPHARIERDGVPLSTIDLVDGLQFSLLVGGDADHWSDAAASVTAQLGIDVAVHRIDGHGILDPYFEWADARQIGHDGAVLVRPDRHIAWRAASKPDNPTGALLGVLQTILDR